MKKPAMKKEDLDKEYFDVSADKTCHVPLIQATKLLRLKKGDLPVIRIPAYNLADSFRWLENEKEKGLFVYNYHIANTKDHLIEVYPEIKVKLHKEFKPNHSGYNPSHKSKEVRAFVDSAIFLELNKMMEHLGDRPAFLERTLH
tara:strand:+ start:81 stop:512 length:432 start_codon:yes stop_codon:yes gene_type:complete